MNTLVIPCHHISDLAQIELRRAGADMIDDLLWSDFAEVRLVAIPCAGDDQAQMMLQHGFIREVQVPSRQLYLRCDYRANADDSPAEITLRILDEDATPIRVTVDENDFIDLDENNPF